MRFKRETKIGENYFLLRFNVERKSRIRERGGNFDPDPLRVIVFFFQKKKKNAHAFEARSVKNTPENTSEPTRRLTREVVENVRETPDTRRETRSTKSILPLVSSC